MDLPRRNGFGGAWYFLVVYRMRDPLLQFESSHRVSINFSTFGVRWSLFLKTFGVRPGICRTHTFIACLNVPAPKWDSPILPPKMTSLYIRVLLPLYKLPFAIFLPSISLYFGEPSSRDGKQKPYSRLGPTLPCPRIFSLR